MALLDDPAQLRHERSPELGGLAGLAVEGVQDRVEGGDGIEHAPR